MPHPVPMQPGMALVLDAARRNLLRLVYCRPFVKTKALPERARRVYDALCLKVIN